MSDAQTEVPHVFALCCLMGERGHSHLSPEGTKQNARVCVCVCVCEMEAKRVKQAEVKPKLRSLQRVKSRGGRLQTCPQWSLTLGKRKAQLPL